MSVTRYALDLWQRAGEALRTADCNLSVSFDAAASRAYYAAFYAASALFAVGDREFSTHAGVDVAVHRDLVKSGRWVPSLGQDYSYLLRLRETGDYGGPRHVGKDEAIEAAAAAKRILDAVRGACPELGEYGQQDGGVGR